MKGQRYIREVKEPRRRVLGMSIAVAAVFLVLLSRLWYLQIIESDNLRKLSENNRLRFVPVAASRGAILDRNGNVLVNNTPSFSVAVVPQDVRDKEALLTSLARYLALDPEELRAKWEKGKGRAKFYPIVIASGISREQLEFLEENRLRLPGLDVEMKPIREYGNGQLAAHLFGYLGEISEAELDKEEFRSYNPGDYVGKSGIERSWERYLHGSDGGRQIEVDARGRYLRTISETSPTIGNSIVLTIDRDLQKRAEQSFGDKAGAAVAIDVNSGEILAFVSNPGFDPSLFTGRMSPQQWKSYLDDKRHPLENKALKGQYPPGSTFKIITALAGLQEGLIDENTTVVCKGAHTVGKDTFKCWDKKGHGVVDLKRALKESCDVYFYQLGERLGVDRIAAYAREFGLGSPVGVGLENEKGGLIPTTAWKEQKYNKKWFRGETLPVSIGQGYTLATPLQLAAMIAGVATEGTVYRPHLVKRVVDPDGQVLREFSPEVLKKVALRPEIYRPVKQGLLAVVNEPRGTGGMARLYEVKVAGKTGTSQVVKMRDSKGGVPYQYRDHALFVAFAPYDKPEVAVAVVVEHGEHGGSAAAPIAGRILRAYFEGKGVIKAPVKGGGDEEDEGGAESGAVAPENSQSVPVPEKGQP
ncbi:penicillin-binding protein 2 [Geomobilimonas luticola]|uniref:Penicillin-binding protein 2 n=1 Tax=Geomobilimonas luticola TaxID=1114878 RepID=A0ABS5SF63_9BACT|nr:penicillin-binding protein 2 [Geomobilimonas luticola]MBT0653996.1 penicillin-binding protein 2 [Geomobilimonas luticola]